MYFTICSSDYITYHSDAHMRAILTHSNTRDALNLSIESLVTAGATQSDFTRSIALVVRQIADLLEQKKPHVAHRFAANLAGAAVSVFLSYFTERQRRLAPGYRPNRTADAIDPLSICAFVGDLFSVRIVTFDEFDDCVSVLLSCTPSAYLFKCLHALIARGSGPAHPKMTSNYLLQCIALIKSMCAKHRNVEFLEAPKLITLIYDIISRTHGGIPQYKIDPRLDLDTALMDSSISPLADWLYASGSTAPTNTYASFSAERRTPLSASSSLSSSYSSMSSLQSYIAKSERRKSQESAVQAIQKPRQIRVDIPPADRTSWPPTTHTSAPPPPPAAPAPLVLHMPRAVPVVQFMNFFREFNQ